MNHDERIRRANLDESLGEGYHRSTTVEQTRAPSASSQHLKQGIRFKIALQNVKAFKRTYGAHGINVLRHDWVTA